jgi:hypothetical protein
VSVQSTFLGPVGQGALAGAIQCYPATQDTSRHFKEER